MTGDAVQPGAALRLSRCGGLRFEDGDEVLALVDEGSMQELAALFASAG